MNNNELKDAYGNIIEVTKEDFELVNGESKIHDKGFDTKPTTFFKDAMKRFSKNHSSVVGAIIIGILILMAIFVPIIDKNPVSTSPYQTLMAPRLFSKGNFWSGKVKYTNIEFDLNTNSIDGFDSKYVTIKSENNYKTDILNTTLKGGTFVLTTNAAPAELNDKNRTTYAATLSTSQFALDDKDVILNYELYKKQLDASSTYANYLEGQYKIIASYTYAQVTDAALGQYKLVTTSIDLKEVSKDKSGSINVTNTIKALGYPVDSNSKIVIKFEIQPALNKLQYIAIDSLSLTSSDATLNESLAKYTIVPVSETGEKSVTYGASAQANGKNYNSFAGSKNVYQADCKKVDFIYDEYEAKFGTQKYTLTKADIQQYIKNGWCKYTFGKPSSFEVIDAKNCPIVSIEKEVVDSGITSFEAEVTMYKYYGYSTMPKFIAGTDNQGRDLFRYAFITLRTSLIIAFIVSAINFTIGIIYGSIEGYFGGNVDLFMERITDILGYLPLIVILTLLMTKYGKTFFVFAVGLLLTGWIGTASRTRTQFYRFKSREYVLASRTLGASDARLIFKHVLPNAIGTIITGAVLMIPGVILSESTLAYLGLGFPGSFGVVLADNQVYLETHPQLILFPSFIISLLMISFNLFGNGLRDAFNPSLKGSE